MKVYREREKHTQRQRERDRERDREKERNYCSISDNSNCDDHLVYFLSIYS